MTKQFSVEASVHKPVGKGFRVKVSLLDLGMYINGMMVFPPDDEHENWSVFTPAQRAGRGKYAYIVEFNKKLPLWAEVSEACVDAVKLEISYQDLDTARPEMSRSFYQDEVVSLDDDKPINLDDIQF